jgi:hypothetical protein
VKRVTFAINSTAPESVENAVMMLHRANAIITTAITRINSSTIRIVDSMEVLTLFEIEGDDNCQTHDEKM